MLNTILTYVIAIFFLLGIVDKVFLQGRLGFQSQLEAGIAQIADLVLTLVGIMCFAPVLGLVLTPVLSPIYTLIGADPANFCGIVLGPDGGAFSLAQSMTENEQVIALSGLFLSSMLGVTVCFSLAFALGVVEKSDQEVLSQGMLAGIIAAPFATICAGLIAGFDIVFMLRSLAVSFAIVVLLVIGILKIRDKVVHGFMVFSKIISACSLVCLGFACFELLSGVKLIPWIGSIDDKFSTVGTMGVTIAGALCMVSFLQRILKRPMAALGHALRINDTAILGIMLSIVNAMPVYAMVKDMDARGKLTVIAFSTPACYALGSHLAFAQTMMAEYAIPMVAGKILGGVMAVAIAYAFFPVPAEEGEEPLSGEGLAEACTE